MPTLRRLFFLLAVVSMQLVTSPLFAQGNGEEEEAGHSWVLAYISIVFMVGLGIAAVGTPTNRENEEQRKKERKEAKEKEERLKKLEQGSH